MAFKDLSPVFHFHPLIADWFDRRFAAPTEPQQAAWPAIREGRDVLISAPTGSGKTLAAFLICLDQLVRAAADDALANECQVLYVSPLKALSNDVQKNLERPLQEIAALAVEQGAQLPAIRTALRTGDTPAWERQQFVRHPAHIVVTTPESLFILLTAERSRAAQNDSNGDRRRDPRHRRRQAGYSPGVVARPAGRPGREGGRQPATANRLVSDRSTD
jgi:ATP-dependent Lhr-like helicase